MTTLWIAHWVQFSPGICRSIQVALVDWFLLSINTNSILPPKLSIVGDGVTDNRRNNNGKFRTIGTLIRHDMLPLAWQNSKSRNAFDDLRQMIAVEILAQIWNCDFYFARYLVPEKKLCGERQQFMMKRNFWISKQIGRKETSSLPLALCS